MEVEVSAGRIREWSDREVQWCKPPRERTVTLPPGLPEFTLGYGVLAWIETELKIPSGPFAGNPFEASYDQALFILWFYAVDEHGEWLHSRGVRRLAKGSGKTPFAAAMALCELLGPVRFDRFDPDVPGGVVGKPVTLPVVQIAATSEDQTYITMRIIRGMANKRTALAKKYQLDCGKTYVETPEGGKLNVLTSSATSAEGAESSFVIADETEHWNPGNGGPDLWHTLRRNLAKTGQRMLETCNAWNPGDGSVSEVSFDEFCTQAEGGAIEEKKPVLYDAKVAPPGTVLYDDDLQPGEVGITDALKFVYSDCPWAAIGAIKQEIWSSSMPVPVSRRFYLNQPMTSSDAWVTPGEWGKLANYVRKPVPGEEIVLFFDGSKSNDHTALIGCCMSDGFVFTLGVWEPDDKTGVINAAKVDACVRQTHDKYAVVAFFADVREWESFVKVSWPELFEEDLILPAVSQGKAAAPIAWDMRSHGFDFAVAAEMCKAEIEDGLFQHDGNFTVANHVANARMVESRGHVTVKKESPKSPKKIDAAVCVIGARMVYRIVLASKEWKKYVGSSDEWVVMVNDVRGDGGRGKYDFF